MRRIDIEKLVRWKESSRRKPLIVEGARQVGSMNDYKEEDWLTNLPLYAVNSL